MASESSRFPTVHCTVLRCFVTGGFRGIWTIKLSASPQGEPAFGAASPKPRVPQLAACPRYCRGAASLGAARAVFGAAPDSGARLSLPWRRHLLGALTAEEWGIGVGGDTSL